MRPEEKIILFTRGLCSAMSFSKGPPHFLTSLLYNRPGNTVTRIQEYKNILTQPFLHNKSAPHVPYLMFCNSERRAACNRQSATHRDGAALYHQAVIIDTTWMTSKGNPKNTVGSMYTQSPPQKKKNAIAIRPPDTAACNSAELDTAMVFDGLRFCNVKILPSQLCLHPSLWKSI